MPAGAEDADVQRLNDAYCAAYNAGDLEKVLGFFAEDALTLSPDQAPVQGREAHRQYLAAGLAREVQRKLTLRSLRHQRFGDLLYDGGEWTNTVSAPGSPARSLSGYYLTVYRRAPGGWKILASTFNLKAGF